MILRFDIISHCGEPSTSYPLKPKPAALLMASAAGERTQAAGMIMRTGRRGTSNSATRWRHYTRIHRQSLVSINGDIIDADSPNVHTK